MKLLICVIFLFLNCSTITLLKKEEFNFKNTGELVDYQDNIFNDWSSGKDVPENTIKSLENNIWIASAEQLAPSNIVIRQFCLIDILRKNDLHRSKIIKQIDCLSYGNSGDRIWAEGYHYWKYTKHILDTWQRIVQDSTVKQMMQEIDEGFAKTAYLRYGEYCPAPFGDLKNIKIDESIDCSKYNKQNLTSSIITRRYISGDSILYTIAAKPIGMNIHIPKNNHTILVVNGIPIGFTYYIDMKHKYLNDVENAQDVLDPVRIKTIGKCK